MKWSIFPMLVFLIFYFNKVYGEDCSDFKTCGKCIGNSRQCVWCPDKNHTGPRCQSQNVNISTWCSTIINPVTEFKTTEDKKFKHGTNPVQLKPQKAIFRARPGVRKTMKLFYKPAKDYPLDIYFLMDNSYTMGFHAETLIDEAKIIYTELTKLTNNVRFGAGSFIEKLALPFARPNTHQAYAFKNNLPMSDNITAFVESVKIINKSRSGNYDSQEAGFDALMQAMVCKEINWRQAWKMIILSTDASYHSAGDGKFVGAYKPNDMKCHTIHGTYEKDQALLYDYPSVSQINKITAENDIAIVFAVLHYIKDRYDVLSSKIHGSQCVKLHNRTAEERRSKQSEIVSTIKEQYTKLVQNVKMTPVSVPSYLDVNLDPTRKNLKHGETFESYVTLEMKSCPSDKDFNKKIKIAPNMLDESLEIDVEILCRCDCERNGEKNSPICNSKGTYQCGVCECNPGSYGERCQCLGSSTEELDLLKCKANKGDAQVCSGRGVCECGKCSSCGDYTGEYCHIALYDCKAPGDRVCAGHGTCQKNNTCSCAPGWTGDDCTCTTDKQSCLGPYGTVCNERGTCVCGDCVCTVHDPTGKNYTGPFCNNCDEDCSRCTELGDYASCNHENDKTYCDQSAGNKYNYTVIKLNETEMNAPEYRKAELCKKYLDDGSAILFKYFDKQMSTSILIQNQKEIPPAANIWIPVGSAIGLVLLIGLVTLIAWKILVDLHDKREYQKFKEQAAADGFDVSENPLYQPPATSIKNPAYDGRLST